MLNDQLFLNRLHILSSFASGKLADLRQAREDDFRLKQDAHQQKQARRQAEWTAQKAQCAAAWKKRQFRPLLADFWGLLRLSFKGSIYPPQLAPPSDEEGVLQAGLEGEDRVLHALFAAIPENWHVVSGYRNNKGETDFILVAPNGLMTIEVKSYSGLICCQGDDWFALNRARGGGIGKKTIQDNGGRSPNQQVNAIADSLEEYLRKFDSSLDVGRVKRAVVFAARNSAIYQVRQPGVDLVCTADSLSQGLLLDFLPPRKSPLDAEKLLKMIKRDHNHHHEKRRTRRAPLSSDEQ